MWMGAIGAMKNSTKSLLIYMGGALFLIITDFLLIEYGRGLLAMIIGILVGLQAFIAAELFKWSYRLEQRDEQEKHIIARIQYNPEQLAQLQELLDSFLAEVEKLNEGDSNEEQK
jgi:hypothetical protein